MTLSEAWVDFIAGWASGAVSVLVIQPVDTVLTRYQANRDGLRTASGALRETRSLVHRNGIKFLWSGSSAMITAVPTQNAMLMGGYGIGKQWRMQGGGGGGGDGDVDPFSSSSESSNLYASVFVGGSVGGIAQSFLMSPVELMKVNQQVNVRKSAREAGVELISGFAVLAAPSSAASSGGGTSTRPTAAGVSSSWRGLGATLLRDGIPHGAW